MKGDQQSLGFGERRASYGRRTRSQVQQRDAALDLLERTRAELVEKAREVAISLGASGDVTSPAVLARMRELGLGEKLDQVDARFMGVVFRGRGWKRVGWLSGADSPGSHARPVALWRRTNA